MILQKDITFEQALEYVRGTYEGNNHVHTVKIEFDDGANKVQMTYATPRGLQVDQRQRKGTLESL